MSADVPATAVEVSSKQALEEAERLHARVWNEACNAMKTAEFNEESYCIVGCRLAATDRRLRMLVAIAGVASLASFVASLGSSKFDLAFKAFSAASGIISALLPWLRLNERAARMLGLSAKWSQGTGRARAAVLRMKLCERVSPDEIVAINEQLNALRTESRQEPITDGELLKSVQRAIELRNVF